MPTHNYELLTETDDALSYIRFNTSTKTISVSQDSNWFRVSDTVAHQQLLQTTRQKIINTIGLPDIYVTGHSANAHLTHAGFYTDPKHARVAVPLVIEPMYAIPRTKYVKITGEPWQLVPNKELDLESTPDDAFDHDPRKVKTGELIIHIRKGNDATFYAPNISDYTATAVFSDMVTYQGQPVPLTVTQTADEYLIEVPEFTCTMVVCININQ